MLLSSSSRLGVIEDIGSWSTVLSPFGYIAVITNATMVTFVGKRRRKLDGDFLKTRHLWLAARLENYKLWAIIAIFEHGILISVCIDVLTNAK